MEEKRELKKSITWPQGTAMTIGAVIGAGILALPAIAADMAGPASLVSWLLMGLFALPMLAAIAQMSSRYPNSGGIAAYAQQAFGSGMGRLTGFLILAAMPIGLPPTALIGANYLCSLFGWGQGAAHIAAGGLILTAILLNMRGIELSGKSQLFIVSAIVFILLFVVTTSFGEVRARNFLPFMPHGAASVGRTMSLLFFAFLGWEMIGHLAEEFRSPRRDIPISLGAAYVTVNIIYFMIAFVIVGSGVYKTGNPNTAMVTLIGASLGHSAAAMVGLLGFVVCYCPVHTYIAGFSRLIYAQAREGYFPAWLGSLDPKYQTPHRALLFFIPLLFSVLFLSWSLKWDLRPLLGIPSATFLMVYAIGMAAAARELPTKAGKACGALSCALSAAVFLFSGWYMLFPIAVALYFFCRYKGEFGACCGK
ncbi:MAG: amino acid permease [Cloacibacillus sp.]